MRLALSLVCAVLSYQLAVTGESLADEGAVSCSSNPCLNQGMCMEQPSGHSCNCTTGFYGTNCEEGVQLVGGSSPAEGRVEVLHDGTWGSVCKGDGDKEIAEVVCRQLGYGLPTVISQSETFGQGYGHIWPYDVTCMGSEAMIGDCVPGEWGRHDCGHLGYLAVGCEKSLAPSDRREWLWLVVGFLLLTLAVAVIALTVTQRMRKAKEKKAGRQRATEMSRRPLPPVPPRATARTRQDNTSGRREEAEYDVPPDDERAGYDVPPDNIRAGYDVPPPAYDRPMRTPPVAPDADTLRPPRTYSREALGEGPSCYRPERGSQPALPPRTFDTYGIHDRPPSDTVVFDTYCIDTLANRASCFSRT
ncbi:CD163 [Branchiostoma lanceolatum]|uniref:CD163 protein n=1 Tax=Branchiostoma lanceolatum TaxID=7740 RepID=A0A8K0ESD3_BRALA|nr:CD163 [Branchiostoma lanceolatum]